MPDHSMESPNVLHNSKELICTTKNHKKPSHEPVASTSSRKPRPRRESPQGIGRQADRSETSLKPGTEIHQSLCEAETLITFGDGDAAAISTEERPLRLLLVSGKPIGEPVRLGRARSIINAQEQLEPPSRNIATGPLSSLAHRLSADALPKTPASLIPQKSG